MIKGVDEFQDLLRISVASAGNDHRLERMKHLQQLYLCFVGDELSAILDSIEAGTDYTDAKKQ